MNKSAVLPSFFLLLTLIVMSSVSASAATLYVTDLTEVAVRSGPGVNYRLIKILKSGHGVETLETRNDWTRVSLGEGVEGWMASRFLTNQKPDRLMVQTMKESIGPLESQIRSLQEENQNLIAMNQELADALEKTRKERDGISSDYNSLKAEAKEFLELKGRFETLKSEMGKKEKEAAALQERIRNTYLGLGVKWFLAGASVLLLGMFLGSRSKKKRGGLR